MSERAAASRDARAELADIYDGALPYVYGYLLSRCGQVAVAEDLTAETLLAAVDAVRRDQPLTVSIAWLIGVARHKLVDHWRRQEREEQGLRAVATEEPEPEDPWDAQLDGLRAQAVLDQLSSHHRSALTLRYLDDLPVADVAALLDRSVHATEALLVRARSAFRRVYRAEGSGDV